MRFDYQPALIDVKIFKTYKQRKLFFALTTGIIGCLIVISSIARSIINYNISPIELNKNLFLSFTNINTNSNSQKLNIENNNINPQIINTENTQIINPISNHINQLNSQIKIVDLQNNTGGVNLNYHVLELPKSLNITDVGKIHPDEIHPDEIKQDEIKQQEENANWQTIKIKSGDTLIGILQGLSMPKVYLKDLNNFVKVNQNCTAVNNLKSGYSIKILLNAENDLQIIKLPLAPHKILHIDKIGPRNYRAYFEEKPIIKKLTFARSKILGSFYAAAQSVGLNDALIMEMADIFGWDIDFSMDVRSNDKFRIIYEEKFVEQEKIGTGHILVAEFINQGQKYQAVRFTDNQGKVGYYTPEGFSMTKTFLRNPVKFTRIGSRFSNSRRHPILHRIRAHKGVDYVAPSGTPIKAAGDGRVILMGYKGGYGNVVELLHGNKYSTLYAHLSHFASGIRKSQVVKQGQVIGYVGRTGLATGDHLHYEFRVDGLHRDPLTVQLPRAMPLPNRYKTKFLAHAQQMISLLNENDISKLNKT